MPNFYPDSPAWSKKLHSTVLPEILPSVTFFTLISIIPCVVYETTGVKLEINTIMLAVLGTMLAFALSLRTSSANERYQEGRKAWSSITFGSRSLAMLVWLHLPVTTVDTATFAGLTDEELEVEKVKALIEKKSIINLIQAFSVSVKHYLRGESGVFYDDLYHLCCCLPKYSFPSSVTAATEDDYSNVLGLWRSPGPEGSTYLPSDPRQPPGGDERSRTTTTSSSPEMDLEKGDDGRVMIDLMPACSPPARTIYHYCPPLVIFRPFVRRFSRDADRRARAQRNRKRRPHIQSNVPLQISLFLSGYFATVIRRGTIQAPLIGIVFGSLNTLQDSITTLERVLTTPLPFQYSAHLRFSVYIYLLFLPFQLHASLGWLTILGTIVAGFVFLGFLELGTQLENPFGYDDSDLDLDHFCRLIARELGEIVAHPQPDPTSYIYSPLSQPFAPDPRTATEILTAFTRESAPRGEAELRKMMSRIYHDETQAGESKHRGKMHERRQVEVVTW